MRSERPPWWFAPAILAGILVALLGPYAIAEGLR